MNERASFIWQFLLGLPVVSGLFTDAYYPSAVAADAAQRVAILTSERDDRMSEQLDALGATRTEMRWGDWRLYEDIHVPGRTYRLAPRTGWRVLGEPSTLPAAADGDLGTAWPERRLDANEAGRLVLDLGVPRAVARVVLWPTALTDVIVPLEIAGSPDRPRGNGWGWLLNGSGVRRSSPGLGRSSVPATAGSRWPRRRARSGTCGSAR